MTTIRNVSSVDDIARILDPKGRDPRAIRRLLADVKAARDLTPDEAIDIIREWDDIDRAHFYIVIERAWRMDFTKARTTVFRAVTFTASQKLVAGEGDTVNEAIGKLREKIDTHNRERWIAERVRKMEEELRAADAATRGEEVNRTSLTGAQDGTPSVRATETPGPGPVAQSADPAFVDAGEATAGTLPLAVIGPGGDFTTTIESGIPDEPPTQSERSPAIAGVDGRVTDCELCGLPLEWHQPSATGEDEGCKAARRTDEEERAAERFMDERHDPRDLNL